MLSRQELKKDLLQYLENVGYSIDCNSFQKARAKALSKDKIRNLHIRQKKDKLLREKDFITNKREKVENFFASGSEINPRRISPYLIEVKPDTLHSDVFRFASLNWSVPVSYGFGRRLRYLVMDEYNDKLIGLIALGDPVLNLRARDDWIGWDLPKKMKNLIHVVDAYVLGAIPPYSNLICGKLVAALLTSHEIRQRFQTKYSNKRSIIKKRNVDSRVALITTCSALGKSSVYDRLKLNGDNLLLRIGESNGFGHFHIPQEYFLKLKSFLQENNHPYANGYHYGEGPNWKFRVIRAGLKELDINWNVLSHGIKREVYAIPLAKNSREFLRDKNTKLLWKTKPLKEIAELCKERWIIPRSERDPSYRNISREQTIQKITSGK